MAVAFLLFVVKPKGSHNSICLPMVPGCGSFSIGPRRPLPNSVVLTLSCKPFGLAVYNSNNSNRLNFDTD